MDEEDPPDGVSTLTCSLGRRGMVRASCPGCCCNDEARQVRSAACRGRTSTVNKEENRPRRRCDRLAIMSGVLGTQERDRARLRRERAARGAYLSRRGSAPSAAEAPTMPPRDGDGARRVRGSRNARRSESDSQRAAFSHVPTRTLSSTPCWAPSDESATIDEPLRLGAAPARVGGGRVVFAFLVLVLGSSAAADHAVSLRCACRTSSGPSAATSSSTRCEGGHVHGRSKDLGAERASSSANPRRRCRS